MLSQLEKAVREKLTYTDIVLESEFYCFDKETFHWEISEHADCLQPDLNIVDPEVDFGPVKSAVYVKPSDHRGQQCLIAAGASMESVISDFRLACRCLAQAYDTEGKRIFFAPKMDGLAPSGHTIRFTGIPSEEKELWSKALLGIHRYAKEMTVAFCRQVNSYKRITPKVITDHQRIPYLKRCLIDATSLHVIADYQSEKGVLSFYLADHYCDDHEALISLLSMMLTGLKDKNELNPDQLCSMESDEERMPNSLAVALDIWKKSAYAKEVFGADQHKDMYDKDMEQWLEYCDIAHPWELKKGAEYEEQ